MNKLIQQTKKLFLSAQGGMFSSAMILSFMIIVSRVFGFARYRILASYFSKDQLDIFFASFRIPDLVFELLITGAITSSLIPIYIRFSKDEKERANIMSSILNIILIVLIISICVLLPLMPIIVPAITPGFHGEKLRLVILFSQILLVGQLPFLVLGNFFTGMAQAKKQFFGYRDSPNRLQHLNYYRHSFFCFDPGSLCPHIRRHYGCYPLHVYPTPRCH